MVLYNALAEVMAGAVTILDASRSHHLLLPISAGVLAVWVMRSVLQRERYSLTICHAAVNCFGELHVLQAILEGGVSCLFYSPYGIDELFFDPPGSPIRIWNRNFLKLGITPSTTIQPFPFDAERAFAAAENDLTDTDETLHRSNGNTALRTAC